MHNSAYRIVTKGLRNRSHEKTWKQTRDQISIGYFSKPRDTLPFCSPHKTQIIAHTPASHKRQPFSPKGELRRNSSIITLTQLWRTYIKPNVWRKDSQILLAKSQYQRIWSKSYSAFRQRIQQKGPTSKDSFLTSQSIVLARPWRTCQVKNLTFIGILILQSNIKTDTPTGEGSTKYWKKDLHENPSKGWGSKI